MGTDMVLGYDVSKPIFARLRNISSALRDSNPTESVFILSIDNCLDLKTDEPLF